MLWGLRLGEDSLESVTVGGFCCALGGVSRPGYTLLVNR